MHLPSLSAGPARRMVKRGFSAKRVRASGVAAWLTAEELVALGIALQLLMVDEDQRLRAEVGDLNLMRAKAEAAVDATRRQAPESSFEKEKGGRGRPCPERKEVRLPEAPGAAEIVAQ